MMLIGLTISTAGTMGMWFRLTAPNRGSAIPQVTRAPLCWPWPGFLQRGRAVLMGYRISLWFRLVFSPLRPVPFGGLLPREFCHSDDICIVVTVVVVVVAVELHLSGKTRF